VTIRLTRQAETDIENIAGYLIPRSPQGAMRVEAAIQEALALIARYPAVGHERRQRVRRFALPRYPYLIFYRMNEVDNAIEVLAIRHAARKPEDPSDAH
jgi:plasmid stabilization system protein ParE